MRRGGSAPDGRRIEGSRYNQQAVTSIAGPIAINASALGARPSGLGRYAGGLVHGLAALGLDLIVHTPTPDAFERLPARVQRACRLVRPERGVLGHVARLAWCQTVLRARVRRDRPSVLLNPLPEGVLASQVPQVTVIHDLIPLAFPRAFPRQQWYFRRLVPAVLRASRAVIAVSEATRQEAIRAYRLDPARVHTVPDGYDPERFRPDGPTATGPDLPCVLFVGNLLPHKNLARLVDAVAQVRRVVPVRLTLIGHGRRREVSALADLARRTAVPVELRGFVADEDLAAWYRAARVVVLPSLAEGFGLTALEAMACGSAVIVSRIPPLVELVADAGLVVDPTDTGALAGAIGRVVGDDRLRKELGERAVRRAAEFSWLRTAREVAAVLEAVERG